MREKPEILVVDDKPENLYVMNKLLQGLDAEVVQALSGGEALQLTLDHDFSVAIVDVQMPGMDGYEMVELLRLNEGTANLPVIFVSAIYSDEYHHRKGYKAGAVDFLSKPLVPEILLSKVQVFIDLYQQRQALQEEIKQRRQAEMALQEANRALSQLNADKDRFFSIISHDLSNPLTYLLGNVDLLVRGSDELSRADIKSMGESIYRGVKAIYNLSNYLLTWSRLQREGGMKCLPEPIELRDFVKNIVAVLGEIAAQKEIELNNNITPGCWVQADRSMLEAVIRNLIGNAIKFTPRGGRVTLAEYSDDVDSQDGLVRVQVQDTGVGIDPDNLTKLFRIDMYQSTLGTDQEPGSGLGLIICKEMVEWNGGRIWVTSDGVPGQGTTVTFTVPLVTPPRPL